MRSQWSAGVRGIQNLSLKPVQGESIFKQSTSRTTDLRSFEPEAQGKACRENISNSVKIN
jgi:hypothetical protein